MTHLRMDWNPERLKILGIWFTNDQNNCESINYQEKFMKIKMYKVC